MKIIQIGTYKAWGSAYADWCEKRGRKVERFFIKEASNKRFNTKKNRILNEVHAFWKILLHIHKFRNCIIFSTGGNCCNVGFSFVQHPFRNGNTALSL